MVKHSSEQRVRHCGELYGSRKGKIQNYFVNPKKYLESISFRQIALKKFFKSRKQLQILIQFIDLQTIKIRNSLQSKNLSKILKICEPRKIYCHVTLARVVSTLSQHDTSCHSRLHEVDLESLRERTKLYQVYCNVLPQMWKGI